MSKAAPCPEPALRKRIAALLAQRESFYEQADIVLDVRKGPVGKQCLSSYESAGKARRKVRAGLGPGARNKTIQRRTAKSQPGKGTLERAFEQNIGPGISCKLAANRTFMF